MENTNQMTQNNGGILRTGYTVDKMPNKRRLPAGKQQFGIIVPTEVHVAASHMAVNRKYGPRISDVYTAGIERLMEEEAHGGPPARFLGGVPEEHHVYFKALRAFLASSPDPQSLQILKAVLGRHLPEELLYERPMSEKRA